MRAHIVLIGCGNVGMSYLEKIVLQPNLSLTISIIDNDENKVEGEILDLEQGLSLFSNHTILRKGSYQDIESADLVVITAGKSQTSKDRMADLPEANQIISDIAKEMEPYKYNGIILVASNPLDVIVELVIHYLDYPKEKVIGTGCMLDTARLKTILGKKLKVNSQDLSIYVLGEHGNSQFVAWTNANLGLQNLSSFLSIDEKERIEEMTRHMGSAIVRKKGCTDEGIACCLTKLTLAVLLDEKKIYSVSHYHYEDEVCYSTPAVIGKNGIEKEINLKLSDQEQEKLNISAKKIEEAVFSILPPELY